MSVTPETSHSPIGPCGPLEQSPSVDRSRHALTAPLSSSCDSGENAATGVWAEQSGKVVKLGGVERKDGNVHEGQRLHLVTAGRVRVVPQLGMYICMRTIAGVR